MDSNGKSGEKNETHPPHQEIKLTANDRNSSKLRDYIPIYVPTVEKALLDNTHDKEKRLLDFLKARPSKDWFLNFGYMIKRLGSLKSTTTAVNGASPPRFRVPFVRKVDWKALLDYCRSWAKKPMNMALLVWLFFVAIGIILLFLLMTGLLNGLIPKSSERNRWTESTNQILNALFTIMCLYQHPQITHHLFLILRWRSSDAADLRKTYCKNPTGGPYERAHIFFVVSLLHLTCLAQYAYCALFWAYTRKNRPNWAVNLFMGLGLGAPIVAGLYMIFGPLGRKHGHVAPADDSSEPRKESGTSLQKRYSRRVVATKPVWVGGLFDFWDDLTVAYLSFFCTFCVFGWNMERLGFGNMYVHIFTFILLCVAPFWVFNVSALTINDEAVRYLVGVIGIILCFLGFLYGGFWRIQMRKRFRLPESRFCCGSAAVTDFMRWLFCWSCSLAQEVRTGNFYDVEEGSLCEKGAEEEAEEEGVRGLEPLEREGSSGPSVRISAPPVWTEGLAIIVVDGAGDRGENRHRMSPPVPVQIQSGT